MSVVLLDPIVTFGTWQYPNSFGQVVATINGSMLIIHADYISTDYERGQAIYNVRIEFEGSSSEEVVVYNAGEVDGYSTALDLSDISISGNIISIVLEIVLGSDSRLSFEDIDIVAYTVYVNMSDVVGLNIYGKKNNTWYKAKDVYAKKDGLWHKASSFYGNKQGWNKS